jgi:hypothetical protein
LKPSLIKWGFFIIFMVMNELIHPKRLRLFMEEIYKNYPDINNHPDYRFYYLYTDYPEISEYLFIVASQYELSNKLSTEINESIGLYKEMFGFTESSILSHDDINSGLKTQLNRLSDQIRGTKFSYVFYEVW